MSASGPPSDDVSPVERRTGDACGRVRQTPQSPASWWGARASWRASTRLLADAAAGRCGALLVEGEPGVGKTTLLEAARSRAGGFTCLRAVGVESESQLAHAGLLGLLNPVRGLLGEVPESQAAALRSALGWSADTATADRFLVGAATLSLLAAAAERRPVLVLVDDLQWLDHESSAAIAVRRPAAGTRRRRVPPGRTRRRLFRPTSPSGLPVLHLGGLSPTAAAALLPSGRTRPVLERLVAGTDGNPLAMLEVSQRLDAAQRLGAAPLPDPLPAGDRLSMLYRGDPGRTVAGARGGGPARRPGRCGGDGPAAVTKVLGGRGVDPGSALDEAREHGVLVREGGRLPVPAPAAAQRRPRAGHAGRAA